MKNAISIPGAPAPLGPYSQAIVKHNTLYVSRQIPLNPISGELVLDSIDSSTLQVMENIKSLILAAGFEMSDIVKCSIFLKSMDDFTVVNARYAEYFANEPPARETVEVSNLPLNVPIEISCIAIK